MLKNYNFFDFFRLNEQNLPDMIWDIVEMVHQTEKEMLINAIKAEVYKCNIKPVTNPEEIVELLLDALHGVRMSSVSNKKTMFPDKEHMEDIRKKRLLMSDIFIKGLMH